MCTYYEIEHIARCMLHDGSYTTFDEAKQVQLCAVVASELSKCEDYG